MEIEILKIGGLAGGFLLIFLVYHNAQRKADREFQTTQLETQKAIMKDNAEREERNKELLLKIIEDQKQSKKEDAETMREFIESMNMQIAQNARIEQKIDSNVWCPVVRSRTNES